MLLATTAPDAPAPPRSPSGSDVLGPARTPAPPPIVTEEVPVAGDKPVYAVRGSTTHARKGVFLAGKCAHPAAYLNTFPYAAAAYGDFVGVQGDTTCGGAMTWWSANPPAIVRRIEKAFDVAGVGELRDATLVGYSQGAERAEWIAAYAPDRFTRFVLISSPISPSAAHLKGAHAVVLMAGAKESQGLMRDAVPRLRAAGIPATFMELPGARHGDMGPMAHDVMKSALDWLEENDAVTKSTKSTAPPVTRRPARSIGD